MGRNANVNEIENENEAAKKRKRNDKRRKKIEERKTIEEINNDCVWEGKKMILITIDMNKYFFLLLGDRCRSRIKRKIKMYFNWNQSMVVIMEVNQANEPNRQTNKQFPISTITNCRSPTAPPPVSYIEIK